MTEKDTTIFLRKGDSAVVIRADGRIEGFVPREEDTAIEFGTPRCFGTLMLALLAEGDVPETARHLLWNYLSKE